MTPTPAPTPSEAPRPVLEARGGTLIERIEAARIAKAHEAGDHRDCPHRRFTARDNSGAIYGRGAA